MTIELVVETGSGVDGANSYSSLTDAETYFTNRGETTWGGGTYTTENQKAALIKATQFVDLNYPWVGYKTGQTNELEWPRQIEPPQYPYAAADQIASGIIDAGGWEISTTSVPGTVVNATHEMALRFLTQTTLILDQDRKAKREKVGEIEVEYEKGSSQAKKYPVVNKMLRGLYHNSSVVILERM